MKGKSTIEKCKFCGYDLHQSQFLVCDTFREYPLPYKISASTNPKNVKNTEPLKLFTEPDINTERLEYSKVFVFEPKKIAIPPIQKKQTPITPMPLIKIEKVKLIKPNERRAIKEAQEIQLKNKIAFNKSQYNK